MFKHYRKIATFLFVLIMLTGVSNKKLHAANTHVGKINLKAIEKITNSKLQEQHGSAKGKKYTVYSWPANEMGEILFVYMQDEKSAEEEAMRLLPLIESGRAKGGQNVNVSESHIGDFSIMPKKITDDPHGFAMQGSDKTFIIFTRQSTVVIVDSMQNFRPKIAVEEIARKIDSLLLK